jgi:hydroxymethylpyrimidine pyrophosphatase-like HAD family hydrolase
VRAEFPDVAFRVAAPGALRIERPEDVFLARDLRSYPPDCVEVSPAEGWRMDDWYKIVFRADAARNAQLRALLQTHFTGVLSAVPSDPTILEVQLAATDKATGIAKLRRHIGEQTRCIITCGDFENDLPMHRAADIAVAPANAHHTVLEIADLVLCSNNGGVIADVVEAIEGGRLHA